MQSNNSKGSGFFFIALFALFAFPPLCQGGETQSGSQATTTNATQSSTQSSSASSTENATKAGSHHSSESHTMQGTQAGRHSGGLLTGFRNNSPKEQTMPPQQKTHGTSHFHAVTAHSTVRKPSHHNSNKERAMRHSYMNQAIHEAARRQ
jgi:hypothetical protein